ncbi:MAG: hypothetical protein A2173_02950 [Planctomycetes bacterium RBG_13_44_8b]|nr:MAG: hypothetical protein A2173_02950 [Planctomycetes bacterium RBG_13_44_8b]
MNHWLKIIGFGKDIVISAQHLRNKQSAGIVSSRIIITPVVKSFVFVLAVLGKTSRMSIYAAK